MTILITGTTSLLAQDDEPEIWYVWLDAQTTVEGKPTRIVGDVTFSITCCIKSPDYSRLEKKAARWIRHNYDESYEGRISLKKIQDADLAKSVISWARKDAENGQDVLIVEYADSCEDST